MDGANPFQGTGHWLAERTGCCTASRINDVLDVRKDGKPGAKRSAYLKELLAERVTGNAMPHVVTQAMRDGTAREPDARAMYEARTGNIVQLCGFVPHPEIEYAGASPDGWIGADGLIEIKAPTDTTFVEWVLAGEIPEQHVGQMTFQLSCTRRKWCDFVAYSPNVRDARKQLFVRRFEPTVAQIEALDDAVRAFLAELDAMFTAFAEAA